MMEVTKHRRDQSMASSLKVNPHDAQELEVPCQLCARDTAHQIAASVTHSGGDGHFDWSTDYQILQCMGCKTVSFRSSATNSEDYYYDDEDNGPHHFETIKIFPPRLAGFSGLGDDVWLLPDKLRLIYAETSQSLVASVPVLTGIGIRAILETLCKDLQAIGDNLLKKIDNLVTQGILTPVRASVLHQIRTLGNKAAHEVAPHSSEQLALAMTVVDHLLAEVYIFPAKTSRLFPAVPGAPALDAPGAPPVLAAPPVPPLPLAPLHLPQPPSTLISKQ